MKGGTVGRITVELNDKDEKKFRDIATSKSYTLKALMIKMIQSYENSRKNNFHNNGF